MTTPSGGQQRGFIAAVHGLRLLAAGMVLLAHLVLENLAHHGPRIRNPGRIPYFTGVDLFFIVSGFIIYYLSHDRFGRAGQVWTFVKHRFVRVVPLYWLCTTLLILVILFQGHLVNNKELDLERVVGSYLFLPIPRADGTFYPVFELGWTLDFEIYFYALFALALGFGKKVGLSIVFGTIIALSAIGLATRTQLPFLIFYTRPITLEFLYGIMLAHLYLKGVRLPLALRLAMILLGFVLLSIVGHLHIKDIYMRFLWGGVPTLLIAAGAILGTDMPVSRWWGRAIVTGGGAAYSLYLTHMFAVRGVDMIWHVARWPHGWPFIVTGFAAAMTLAVLVFRFVETPLLAFMRRRVDRPRG